MKGNEAWDSSCCGQSKGSLTKNHFRKSTILNLKSLSLHFRMGGLLFRSHDIQGRECLRLLEVLGNLRQWNDEVTWYARFCLPKSPKTMKLEFQRFGEIWIVSESVNGDFAIITTIIICYFILYGRGQGHRHDRCHHHRHHQLKSLVVLPSEPSTSQWCNDGWGRRHCCRKERRMACPFNR